VIKELLLSLMNRLGMLMMLALFLSRTKLFKRLVTKQNITFQEKLMLTLIFGILGSLGSYFSISFHGALVNTRIIGVAAGGLLGGPLVGFGAGLLAGVHRWFIDIGGFTTFACSVSTVIEGTAAGLCYFWVKDKKNKWVYGFLFGVFGELFRKLMVILFARPFSDALELVRFITVPMVAVNSIGLAMFIAMIQSVIIEEERVGAFQAKLALNIANKTLPYLRKGINKESARKTAEIIMSIVDFEAVAITDRNVILAHIGAGEDHHLCGAKVLTQITRKVISTGKYAVARKSNEIECSNPECPLKSAIIVPLKEEDKVIGTLKLYKRRENDISHVDIELALGLAQLFSTQLELSKIEYQSKLLTLTELKALQSQINPHFLFNTLNTISILCRIQPETARNLINNLAEFYRNNLRGNSILVELETELNHVRSYISIEKARFMKKLNVVYEIDSDLKCLIPPLTIQPIVENAINHGILPKEEGGIVSIKLKDLVSHVEIQVEDNGVGMDKKTIQNALDKDGASVNIGLYNVKSRLKCIYGDSSSLDIESEKGKGTRVTIKIPKDYKVIREGFYAEGFVG